MRVKTPTSAFINCVLGQLFVRTVEIQFLSTKCDYYICKSSQVLQMTVEY